jgi:hypothetical protein
LRVSGLAVREWRVARGDVESLHFSIRDIVDRDNPHQNPIEAPPVLPGPGHYK